MIYIFTFTTDLNKVKYLKETSELHNVNITYIYKSNWGGYTDKLFSLKESISSLKDDDIICFIDAYDVLVNNSIDTIISKFKEYNCDMVIGAELNCYPDNYKSYYPNNNTTKYRYVNSGGFIGYKYALHDMLCWKSPNEIIQTCSHGGDQSYVTEYYLFNNSYSIKLDSSQNIFQNMHLVHWNDFIIEHGKIKNIILNTYPSFVHFNGGTWQTNTKENIMPVIVDLIKLSNSNTNIYTLHEYPQIITATCKPISQI